MKIISKRQAMAIYRQHPQSRLFRFCAGKYMVRQHLPLRRSGSAGYQRRARRLRRTPSGPQRPVRRITQRYAELIHV